MTIYFSTTAFHIEPKKFESHWILNQNAIAVGVPFEAMD
jgi:hypothetical protein